MKNLIIISAPSGAGKTTLCRALQKEMNDIQWSISYTTRMKRKMEKNGTDYYFISISEFQSLIKNNSLAEWERVHGHYYGTEKKTLEIAMTRGFKVIVETGTSRGKKKFLFFKKLNWKDGMSTLMFSEFAHLIKGELHSCDISEENIKLLKTTSPLKINNIGKGKVIYLTDNTNFRAFWYGTNKILMNAIFFSKIM